MDVHARGAAEGVPTECCHGSDYAEYRRVQTSIDLDRFNGEAWDEQCDYAVLNVLNSMETDDPLLQARSAMIEARCIARADQSYDPDELSSYPYISVVERGLLDRHEEKSRFQSMVNAGNTLGRLDLADRMSMASMHQPMTTVEFEQSLQSVLQGVGIVDSALWHPLASCTALESELGAFHDTRGGTLAWFGSKLDPCYSVSLPANSANVLCDTSRYPLLACTLQMLGDVISNCKGCCTLHDNSVLFRIISAGSQTTPGESAFHIDAKVPSDFAEPSEASPLSGVRVLSSVF
jgi:hypothetical protein